MRDGFAEDPAPADRLPKWNVHDPGVDHKHVLVLQ